MRPQAGLAAIFLVTRSVPFPSLRAEGQGLGRLTLHLQPTGSTGSFGACTPLAPDNEGWRCATFRSRWLRRARIPVRSAANYRRCTPESRRTAPATAPGHWREGLD